MLAGTVRHCSGRNNKQKQKRYAFIIGENRYTDKEGIWLLFDYLVIYKDKDILAICWKNTRNVDMISTRHCADMFIYVNKRGQEKSKPPCACVMDYNNNEIGMYLSDKRLSNGVFRFHTVKW